MTFSLKREQKLLLTLSEWNIHFILITCAVELFEHHRVSGFFDTRRIRIQHPTKNITDKDNFDKLLIYFKQIYMFSLTLWLLKTWKRHEHKVADLGQRLYLRDSALSLIVRKRWSRTWNDTSESYFNFWKWVNSRSQEYYLYWFQQGIKWDIMIWMVV